jgi:Zn-dependent oligopeptidase
MMQEKWAWDKSTFLSFARHYQTGEQLSEEVYENMRRFGQGALQTCVGCHLHTAIVGCFSQTALTEQGAGAAFST